MTGPAYLSPDWLDAWSDAEQVEGARYDGPPATVEVRVVGGPDDTVTWHAELTPGAAPRYRAGPAVDATVTYDQAWDDAAAQLEGRFDPCVAFMQGYLKVKGPTRPLYELFRVWASPAHRAAWATVAVNRPATP